MLNSLAFHLWCTGLISLVHWYAKSISLAHRTSFACGISFAHGNSFVHGNSFAQRNSLTQRNSLAKRPTRLFSLRLRLMQNFETKFVLILSFENSPPCSTFWLRIWLLVSPVFKFFSSYDRRNFFLFQNIETRRSKGVLFNRNPYVILIHDFNFSLIRIQRLEKFLFNRNYLIIQV